MTMHATTSDLAAGTERNTWQIPGYAGFQTTTAHNKLAVEHSMGEKPRTDGKVLLLSGSAVTCARHSLHQALKHMSFYFL